MTSPPGPGLHQRVGFAIGVRIGRALRAVHFRRHPLQVVPKLGPWLMRYSVDYPLEQTGLMVAGGSSEIAISGGRKDHPGTIVGLRWRLPRETDRSWSRQWPSTKRGTARP